MHYYGISIYILCEIEEKMEVYLNKLLACCNTFWHFKYFLKKLLPRLADLTIDMYLILDSASIVRD